MKKLFFTPGPSELFPTVPAHLKNGLKENVYSMSHRGSGFQNMYENTCCLLKKLLNISDDYQIFFLSSATESMERVIENCVEEKSFHFVNGAFSDRFFKTAQELGKKPQKCESKEGCGFGFNKTKIPQDAELVCFTHNETSTGVAVDLGDIQTFKRKFNNQSVIARSPRRPWRSQSEKRLLRTHYPVHPRNDNWRNALIALDIVSSVPYVDVNYSFFDCVFFSVQKGFGLPAGLGVLIVSPKAMEKSSVLQKKGIPIGSYHSFSSLLQYGEKFQTPETPNVLGIYLLGKVAKDMLEIGIQKIRKETEEKAQMMYDFFEKSGKFRPFVRNPKDRSQTVLTIEVRSGSKPIIEKLKKKGIIVGSGYGAFKESHIRIANFPAITRRDVKKLLEVI